jgi:hypothetical protein
MSISVAAMMNGIAALRGAFFGVSETLFGVKALRASSASPVRANYTFAIAIARALTYASIASGPPSDP